MNRIQGLRKQAGTKPIPNMFLLLNKLGPGLIVPEPDKYYVFVYTAKTPNIRDDQHPFIMCTSVFKWGFTGFNYHWNEHRRYTWQEVSSNIFQIYDEEVEEMKSFPIPLFKQT